MPAKLAVNALVKGQYAHVLPAFGTLHALTAAFSIASMHSNKACVAHEYCQAHRMHFSWEKTRPDTRILGFAAQNGAGQI